MGRTLHQQAKELFLRAQVLSPPERTALLDEACAEDPDLRAEVESLLAHDAAAGSFLERGAGIALTSSEPLPKSIGSYRVISRLGEGGMGVVYEAEQATPRRAVALKVLRTGAASSGGLRRFEQEVEFLGRLEHPGIARIFEAGLAGEDLGRRPYFAMELVEGKPITSCDLDRDGRLALLLEVCSAVQHAHSRGIVHRDLKPENILIDAEGRPKILDFGIALALDPDTTSGLTQTGLLLGTVQYMSPEQALAVPGEVDARTDVYSLGVIGYELLSGRFPYEVSSTNPIEALRTIREVEPTPLGSVRAELGADLETIFHKALEKERTRRYASVADFADDVRRFLDGEPILARPASAVERLAKWARRHRTLVLAFGIALTGPVFAVLGQAVPAFAALVLGLIGTSIGLFRSMRLRREAEAERRIARREAEKARAMNQFLQEMLASVQSAEQGHDVRVVDVLDRAAERLGETFRDRPEIEGPLRLTLGKSYRGLAQYDRAMPQLELALELCTRGLGPGHEDSLSALGWIGILLCEQGRHAEAEPLQARLIELRRRYQGEDHPETLTSTGQMSSILRATGRKEAAIRNQRTVVASLERIKGPDAFDTAAARGSLASLLGNNDLFEEAEVEFRRAIPALKATHAPGDANLMAVLSNFAAVLHGQHKVDEAEPVYLELLSTQEQMLGKAHPHYCVVTLEYARLLASTGRLADAETRLRYAQPILRDKFGEGHVYASQATNSLGEVLLRSGRPEEAEPFLAEGLARLQGRRADLARCQYGACLAKLGRIEEARGHLEEGYRAVRESLGADHPSVKQAAADLAELPT